MRLSRIRAVSTVALLCATFIASPGLAVNDWDERIEGTLPLPSGYSFAVAPPDSGVESVVADTGETVLRCVDARADLKQGRIDRGNWTIVNGVTLHVRFRVLSGDNDVMSIQLNDGLASGRLRWAWRSGSLTLLNGAADAGQPSSIACPANTWIELWIEIANHRYTVHKLDGASWTIASRGATAPEGSGGAVYFASGSTTGMGAMDVDFWRLETTGGYAPTSPGAPCALPSANLAVDAAANPVISGESTQIRVENTQRGVCYQLQNDGADVGSPVWGTGGTISIPTGSLTANSTFSVTATNSSGAGCSVQLAQTQTIVIATPAATIFEAKAKPDGSVIHIPGKLVSASTAAAYWIEEDDRSSSVKVSHGSLPRPGTRVSLTGTLATVGAERVLQSVVETQGEVEIAPRPIGMSATSLGGAALNAYTPGVEAATGPNNIGILARIWGRVTAIGDGYYYVDDGSNVLDGTCIAGAPLVGVRILAAPGDLQLGEFALITGISSGFIDDSSRVRRAFVPISADCAPPRTDLAVSAADPLVCHGQSTQVMVCASEADVNYQLQSGGANVGSPVDGTGETVLLPTGPITTPNTFEVVATRVAGGCSARLYSTATVGVRSLPRTDLSVSASPNIIIFGQSTNIGIALSEVGVSYQLRNDAGNTNVGGPAIGTGSTIYIQTGPLTQTTTFNVLATNSYGCSAELYQKATVTVEPEGTVHSKIGLHVVCGSRAVPPYTFRQFLETCSNAGRPVAVIKCLDDMSAANEAKQVNPATVTVGRLNEVNGHDLQGLDHRVSAGDTPQQAAQWYYSIVKPEWQKYPWIDVWETCNEWSWHWAWQADFYIAMMDLAEADGFRTALWMCSVGNPPEAYYPDIARACQRAKAHGSHILALHEYGLWEDGLLMHNPTTLVTRYRKLYSYLKANNADVPLVLSEVGQGAGEFLGTELFVMDHAWYDNQMRQDDYVIGSCAWILGDCWLAGANCQEALPDLAEYISTH